MRIRKRSAFLSLLSSDLSQRREANEQHKNEEKEEEGGGGGVQHETHLSDQREIKKAPSSHLQPSNKELPTIPSLGFQQITAGNDGQKSAGSTEAETRKNNPKQMKDEREGEDEEDEEEKKEISAKYLRSNHGAKGNGEYPSRASRRWCKGETIFPLKKRKAIDYNDGSEGEDANDNRNTIAWSASSHHIETEENRWKCSRRNGRGWRCSKPTLVGYSLCEHHLGKGRRIKTINTLLHGKQTTTERKKKNTEGRGDVDVDPTVSQKIYSDDHSCGFDMDVMN